MPTVRTKQGTTKAEADWLEAVVGIIRTRIREAGDRGT